MPSIRRSWFGSAGSSAAVPLDTEEGRALLQDRIGFFGKLGFLLSLFFYVVLHVAEALTSGYAWRSWADADALLHLATAGVLGLVWLACRTARLGPPGLAALDLAGATFACLGASLPVLLPEAGLEYKARMLLVITNALIARAAVVPTNARWTLAVSSVAVVPAIAISVLYHTAPHRQESVAAIAFNTVVVTAWCALAIAIASVTSRVIYGLRQRVEEARQLGQYTLEEKIGAGGMGEVYRARHAMLRRPTAVKLLPPGRGGEDALRRFEREVQLTSILTHPNTVAVFDYGRTPSGVFYYAMEFLDGVNLDDLVAADGPQSPSRVAHILRQVLGSLAEAHGVGLIHRDVKPANLILCERGGRADVVKVVDFGLVRALEGSGDSSMTNEASITGTPLYLAPEAITAPSTVGARSDLYSLGAVAYYLLTGQTVFDGRNVVEVCSHHLHTAPIAPSDRLGRPLPATLESLVMDCLRKDMASRPESARALLGRLDSATDLAPWTEEQARAWWRGFSPRPSGTRAAAADSAISQALTVDLRDRAAV